MPPTPPVHGKMLSPDETLCFLHIPKTAGLTLRTILDLQFAQADICPAEEYASLQSLTPDELARYRLLRGHFWYNVKDLVSSQTVLLTVLRDPIERTLSQYEYVRTNPANGPLHDLAKNMSLEEYVRDEYLRECTVRDVQTRYLAPARQPVDVYEVVPLTHLGLDAARANLGTCTFVGIVERFDDMLKLLSYTFGWRPIRDFAIRNQSQARLSRSDVPGPVLDYLYELNANDLKLYDVAKSIFEERFAAMTEQLNRDRYERARALRARRHSSVRVNFACPIDGDGWYPPEISTNGQAFRWTGPGLTASIDLPLLPRIDRVLSIKVMDWADVAVREALTIAVNGRPLTMSAAPANPTLLTADLPAHLLREDQAFTTITIHVTRTSKPFVETQGDNPDDRALGIPIAWIEATALQDALGTRENSGAKCVDVDKP
jgi:hypothetical protein